jgi:hypothetical protein
MSVTVAYAEVSQERVTQRLVLVFALLFVAVACATDPQQVMLSDSSGARMHHVRPDASFLVAASMAERRQQELDLIRQIEQRLPVEERTTQINLLRSTSPMATDEDLALRPKGTENVIAMKWVGSSDPAMADLLGKLNMVRAEMMRTLQREKNLRPANEPRPVVTVRIGLVSQLRLSPNQALVIRQPDDAGIPLIVISDGAIKTSHFERALSIAMSSHDRMPRGPKRASTARIGPSTILDADSGSARESSQWGPLIARLLEAQPTRVGQVGELRALELRLSRALDIVQ